MKWEDTGFVLSARKYSERDALLTVCTHQHGVWRALVKGGLSSRQRGMLEPGNLLQLHWNARLAEHLGTFSCEMIAQHAALIMQDRMKLTLLSSLCALLEGVLQERDPHPALFEGISGLIGSGFQVSGSSLTETRHLTPETYVLFELTLLAETGFGLDLSACAATGVTHNLAYISPKTGRAVSREAGAPYHDKLLPLPSLFLHENNAAEPSQILDALRVTGYFLQAWLYAPRDKKLPAARERLVEMIERGYECRVSGFATPKTRNPEPETL